MDELFSWLVNNYYDRVLKAALYYLRNVSDAEDITQEVFIKAFEKIDLTKINENKFPILFTITKNLSINKIKSKAYKDETIPNLDLITSKYNIENDYIKKENIIFINKHLSLLSNKDREILVLKHYQDCSYNEISQILKIPIGTVMSRLFSARKKLFNNMKGEGYE